MTSSAFLYIFKEIKVSLNRLTLRFVHVSFRAFYYLSREYLQQPANIKIELILEALAYVWEKTTLVRSVMYEEGGGFVYN